jgi:hypothetical protein
VVYKRSVQRPNINDGDRIFWMAIMRFLREWKDAVVIVSAVSIARSEYLRGAPRLVEGLASRL